MKSVEFIPTLTKAKSEDQPKVRGGPPNQVAGKLS